MSEDGVHSGVYEYTSYTDASWTVVSSITTIMSGLAIADPVILGWQIHDIGTFPKAYVESLVDRFSVDTPISTSTPTATPNAPKRTSPPTSPPGSEGLSTSTQIGIGVGVALGAAVVGGLVIFWFLRRKRKLASTVETPDTVIPEMEDQDHVHSQRKWFLGGRWRTEVEEQDMRKELDSKAVHVVPGPPVELEASEPHVDMASSDQAGETAGRGRDHV
jgi:hypothetical protein